MKNGQKIGQEKGFIPAKTDLRWDPYSKVMNAILICRSAVQYLCEIIDRSHSKGYMVDIDIMTCHSFKRSKLRFPTLYITFRMKREAHSIQISGHQAPDIMVIVHTKAVRINVHVTAGLSYICYDAGKIIAQRRLSAHQYDAATPFHPLDYVHDFCY